MIRSVTTTTDSFAAETMGFSRPSMYATTSPDQCALVCLSVSISAYSPISTTFYRRLELPGEKQYRATGKRTPPYTAMIHHVTNLYKEILLFILLQFTTALEGFRRLLNEANATNGTRCNLLSGVLDFLYLRLRQVKGLALSCATSRHSPLLVREYHFSAAQCSKVQHPSPHLQIIMIRLSLPLPVSSRPYIMLDRRQVMAPIQIEAMSGSIFTLSFIPTKKTPISIEIGHWKVKSK